MIQVVPPPLEIECVYESGDLSRSPSFSFFFRHLFFSLPGCDDLFGARPNAVVLCLPQLLGHTRASRFHEFVRSEDKTNLKEVGFFTRFSFSTRNFPLLTTRFLSLLIPLCCPDSSWGCGGALNGDRGLEGPEVVGCVSAARNRPSFSSSSCLFLFVLHFPCFSFSPFPPRFRGCA